MFEVKNLLDQYDTNKVDQVSLSQFKVFFIMFYNSLPQPEDGTGPNDDQMMTMIMVVVVIITMPDHQMMMADLEEAGWRKIQPKKVFMDCIFTINTWTLQDTSLEIWRQKLKDQQSTYDFLLNYFLERDFWNGHQGYLPDDRCGQKRKYFKNCENLGFHCNSYCCVGYMIDFYGNFMSFWLMMRLIFAILTI